MSGTDETKRLATSLRPEPAHRAVLGAAAASTVVTVRPALAQTAGSVLNCEIPVPGPHAGGNYIAPDGSWSRPARPARRRLWRARCAARRCARCCGGATPAGVDPQLRSGLCQLYQAPADGDERLYLLRLAADAALS